MSNIFGPQKYFGKLKILLVWGGIPVSGTPGNYVVPNVSEQAKDRERKCFRIATFNPETLSLEI